MKQLNLSYISTLAILSVTAITITALTLDFTGVIDFSCNAGGCNVRLEKVSGE